MKLDLKWLLYIPIIFLFFPAFYCSIGGSFYTIFYFVLFAALVFCIISNPNSFIQKMSNLIKITPFKWFVILLLFIIFNSIFLSFIGVTTTSQSVKAIMVQLILGIIPVFVYFTYIIERYISFEEFLNKFLLLFWFFLVVGFICYIGQLFDINIINNIFDFFANVRIMQTNTNGTFGQASDYFAYGLPRLDNLCDEPSAYAQFLFLFLPLVYFYGTSDFELCKNKILNKFITKTMIPFTWLSIILTFSPIYLILCLILTGIYYFKEIYSLIKKYFVIICMVFLLFIITVLNIDFSETYISRIINVISNVKSFDDFILIEPSLATRFCSYINTFCVFLKYPIFGVGIGNIANKMYVQYLHSPVSLTPEIINLSRIYIASLGRIHMNYGYIYVFLAENGIFAFLLLAIYYIKLFGNLINIQKIKNDCIGNLQQYAKTIIMSIIGIVILSFYNLPFTKSYVYLIFGIAIIYIYKVKTIILESINNDEKK